jgi:hypothetical protein
MLIRDNMFIGEEISENSNEINFNLSTKALFDILIHEWYKLPNAIIINKKSYNVNFNNKLTFDELIRLGNKFMRFLAEEGKKIDAPMTRMELIEFLKSLDKVDPTGEMPITLGSDNLEISDVDVIEYGNDKVINIK